MAKQISVSQSAATATVQVLLFTYFGKIAYGVIVDAVVIRIET